MKLLLPIIFLCLIISCSVKKQETSSNLRVSEINQSFKHSEINNDTIRIANDSLEYEIIILEPGFTAWLVSQVPPGYYDQIFLEQRNNIFVTNYNIRANNPTQFGTDLYPLPIDYDSSIDYGYEVNYLLYFYFIYFQQKYNQRLR
jgi:hypothetical protein